MKLLSTEEALYSCVRCGTCREVCPTLDITGREADGPRGRVLMARSLIEGEIPVNDEIKYQLDRCLLCSACVDICPMDVPVPDIVMLAKEKIQETQKLSPFTRFWRNLVFGKLLPHQNRLQLLGHFLWFYQVSGLRWMVRKLGVMKLFPESMRNMEEIMPKIPSAKERKALPVFTARARSVNGAPAAKAAMFRGCIMDVMFRKTNENSIRLLSEAGFDVWTPTDQVCCGALHLHNGNKEIALELAKQNIEVFEKLEVDFIVSNAGGCGAMLREYEELFRNDEQWLSRARRFSSKIRDISEVVLENGALPELVGKKERVTYQPSCHLQYVMGVKDAPKRLLKSVKNTTYVELPDSKLCCGSAGIYNLLQPQLAGDILDKKMNHVKSTTSDVLITANPGCLLQMQMGVYKAGLQESVRVMHIVDFLMESMDRGKERHAEETIHLVEQKG